MRKPENPRLLQSTNACGILNIQNRAILCPNCRRKIRGVRIQPEGVMRNISVKCHDCGAEIIVNIDEASATYSCPRR